MTREEAIITLTNTASLLRDGTRYMKSEHEKQFREAYDMAIKALEQEQKWIPCTPDTMPEEVEKTYWVCTDAWHQCECRWTNDMYGLGANEWSKWGWHVMDKPQYSKIIAWMPLPEPYRGEQE